MTTPPLHPPRASVAAAPQPYSLALRLRNAGVPDDQMCNYLDIEAEALAPILELAGAKLASITDSEPNTSEGQS
ncbi:hypothetical protein CJ179_46365 [Rhodococcus sp. ACS1]|uniref:hypothetical protein n=1 Tax=Rhodococcus sp. ACS1 TaxID=2028570 RepID=UPI000BB146B1|nr:hypothetical protein [Rhodococcus sp. ACS1]PBC35509.1 hypothetical protein CJ179_46365 [Rhodococcus sp. ACS1]